MEVCLDEVFLGGFRGGAPKHFIRRINYLNKHVEREKENYRRAHGGCKVLEQYEEEKLLWKLHVSLKFDALIP